MWKRVLWALIVVLAAGTVVAESVDTQACSTTFEVITCHRKPVPDQKVKITLEDGSRFRDRTDETGRIQLHVCSDTISDIKIAGVDSRRVAKTVVVEESDTERLATITLSTCGA